MHMIIYLINLYRKDSLKEIYLNILQLQSKNMKRNSRVKRLKNSKTESSKENFMR